MYTVYVLRDQAGTIYKGCTNDLKRRLKEHRSGKTKTTSRMLRLRVVYIENFETFIEARKREVYFKSAAGRRYLKKILGS
jgi:putative endonuclease